MTPKSLRRRGLPVERAQAAATRPANVSMPLGPEQVRAIAREEFRRLLGRLVADEPAAYSTRRGGPRPPGVSAEAWREQAPQIPGARKPGRWWIVPAAAYEAWIAARSTTPTSPAPATDTPIWDPESVVVELGLRRGGGPR
jgi:hypothetical protein